MSENSFSEFGNFRSGVKKLSEMALLEAVRWADALMDYEYRGRGDREKSARHRVSRRTGVTESYLVRLKYRSHEMKDVAGSVYRALKLAYDEQCQRNEEAADRHSAERIKLRGNHEKADEKSASAGVGMDSSDH